MRIASHDDQYTSFVGYILVLTVLTLSALSTKQTSQQQSLGEEHTLSLKNRFTKRQSKAKMSSTPIELPVTTRSLRRYRIVCCAPYYHKPFTWSRKYQSGYNTLFELDLPKHSSFCSMDPVSEYDCHTTLLWHVQKYCGRAWRRNNDW